MNSCGKKRFRTIEAAIDRRIELDAPTLRIYLCDKCGGYHFTSKPIRLRRNKLKTKHKKK
jgi:hypothetical protein